ncbi:MAG: peptide chain release factor N(5)-glutamine methyltransferase, partial [Bacteroidota bacterium]
MFVSDNKVSTAKAYFKARLAAQFSDIAIKQMWQAILEVQFGWSPTEQLLNADERLSESDLLAIRKVVNGLLAHEPFQYLIGETLFDGLRIKCDQRALIPRPETEELVHVLSDLNRNFESILDACTGSACLALALKKRFPTARVHATDLSEEALELSRENAAQLQLEITFECADMLQYSASQSYDLIVSNPP